MTELKFKKGDLVTLISPKDEGGKIYFGVNYPVWACTKSSLALKVSYSTENGHSGFYVVAMPLRCFKKVYINEIRAIAEEYDIVLN